MAWNTPGNGEFLVVYQGVLCWYWACNRPFTGLYTGPVWSPGFSKQGASTLLNGRELYMICHLKTNDIKTTRTIKQNRNLQKVKRKTKTGK
jgi:hypothetical protein